MVAISAVLDFVEKKPDCDLSCGVTEDDVSLPAGDARWMLIKIGAPRFQTFVLLVHGFDKAYGQDMVDGFWWGYSVNL